MSAELVLTEAVRAWVQKVLPGDEKAADAAVAVALRRYADGASVSEACREARRLIGCWARHPSREPVAAGPLARAS